MNDKTRAKWSFRASFVKIIKTENSLYLINVDRQDIYLYDFSSLFLGVQSAVEVDPTSYETPCIYVCVISEIIKRNETRKRIKAFTGHFSEISNFPNFASQNQYRSYERNHHLVKPMSDICISQPCQFFSRRQVSRDCGRINGEGAREREREGERNYIIARQSRKNSECSTFKECVGYCRRGRSKETYLPPF